MTFYQFMDRADAFIETDAWLTIEAGIIATAIFIGLVILGVQKIRSKM